MIFELQNMEICTLCESSEEEHIIKDFNGFKIELKSGVKLFGLSEEYKCIRKIPDLDFGGVKSIHLGKITINRTMEIIKKINKIYIVEFEEDVSGLDVEPVTHRYEGTLEVIFSAFTSRTHFAI